MAIIEEIKGFWDKKAEEKGTDCKATLGEVNLRELEIKAILKYLKDDLNIIDIGCGNGFSTITFAKRIRADFVGMDYSEKMVHRAKQNLQNQDHNALLGKVIFKIGDVLELKTTKDVMFDIAVTERCLQNLPSWELQLQAMVQIGQILKSGGLFIMTEGSLTGVDNLSRMRTMIGRSKLEDVIPWHNKFFNDQQLMENPDIRRVYDFVRIDHFCSTYMFVTRVFGHKYAGFAKRLPNLGSFGYIKAYIWRRK